MRTAFLAAALVLVATTAHAFTARVTSFHDGDTCRADTGQGVVEIHLAEIDVPEIDQRYGTEAQVFICPMICGRFVDIGHAGPATTALSA